MRVFLIAGEPSGDRLGAALMAGLKTLVGSDLEFDGVGGPAMAAEGLSSRFPMDELSVMGIAEVLPRYRQLRRRIAETAEAVIAEPPDVLITIDSPDFCLRVARRVRARARVRAVHYVAPSVWAWRPGRAAKMAKSVDQVLALLPFEPPYFQAVGLRCDFVGHPVASEPQATEAQIAAFRDRAGLGTAPVLVVLPGSRRSEVERLTPVFGQALEPVLARRPDLRVVLPAAAPVAETVRNLTMGWQTEVHVIDPGQMPEAAAQIEKRAAFATAEAALAASGTVSLELAAAATPMVVAYDMSWVSWQIVSRMVSLDSVTLVNLVSESRTVPEFLGPECRPGPIGAALDALLSDPGRRGLQLEAMARTMTRLGRGGDPPGLRAARAVLDGLGGS